MSTFNIEQEEITAFEFDQTYLFKHYFNEDNLFQQIEDCYNSDKRLFEVAETKVSQVSQILNSFSYELEIANQPI